MARTLEFETHAAVQFPLLHGNPMSNFLKSLSGDALTPESGILI